MPVIGKGYVGEVEVQFRGIAWLEWTFSVLTTCRWCYDWILLCHGTTSKTILINSLHPRKTCELASWTDLWKKVWSQCLAGSSCSLTVVCFTANRGQNASWSTVKRMDSKLLYSLQQSWKHNWRNASCTETPEIPCPKLCNLVFDLLYVRLFVEKLSVFYVMDVVTSSFYLRYYSNVINSQFYRRDLSGIFPWFRVASGPSLGRIGRNPSFLSRAKSSFLVLPGHPDTSRSQIVGSFVESFFWSGMTCREPPR